jgi:glycosyltransferase involved in cell wall biosynthesis
MEHAEPATLSPPPALLPRSAPCLTGLSAESPAAAPRPRRSSVTLLVPTLNEAVGMRAVMPLVRRDWVDQILVLDGGSDDGTVEWALDHGYEVHVQTEPGIRQGYLEALPLVRGDVILTFSPDGNSIPDLIPDLVAKIDEGYDMVIASRYKPPARSADDDLVTAFGNWLFTRTVNLLHGGRYTDAMVIFRAYRKSLIRDLELDQDRWYRTPERLFGCRISWEPLLSARAARRGLKVAEIPGDEPPRIGGERKLRVLRWGASYYFQFVRDLLLWR